MENLRKFIPFWGGFPYNNLLHDVIGIFLMHSFQGNFKQLAGKSTKFKKRKNYPQKVWNAISPDTFLTLPGFHLEMVDAGRKTCTRVKTTRCQELPVCIRHVCAGPYPPPGKSYPPLSCYLSTDTQWRKAKYSSVNILHL